MVVEVRGVAGDRGVKVGGVCSCDNSNHNGDGGKYDELIVLGFYEKLKESKLKAFKLNCGQNDRLEDFLDALNLITARLEEFYPDRNIITNYKYIMELINTLIIHKLRKRNFYTDKMISLRGLQHDSFAFFDVPSPLLG
ncbi:unnamed protein product [Ilex paraguariensis]|uniref:Uncharacterized protein n=1 Tax=Ilex paraguariensis TaxID=185542 RepID=A0ABC8RBL1_9AQUA